MLLILMFPKGGATQPAFSEVYPGFNRLAAGPLRIVDLTIDTEDVWGQVQRVDSRVVASERLRNLTESARVQRTIEMRYNASVTDASTIAMMLHRVLQEIANQPINMRVYLHMI